MRKASAIADYHQKEYQQEEDQHFQQAFHMDG